MSSENLDRHADYDFGFEFVFAFVADHGKLLPFNHAFQLAHDASPISSNNGNRSGGFGTLSLAIDVLR